ncbi:hypothetical protein N0V93_000329 [Gnomoniopsis smithogilvyi]|uniref:25S rRNA (Uridine(2843)-N(3))-methyltransferase n=1 Tax=Gnomoniopsis smithogilvyi TaxID=1191159 RepID=A0A9W8YZL7_9PEZI|nr:hypothetical protein N0V93_000329 [Gnomoniopsis smithogilvyi]
MVGRKKAHVRSGNRHRSRSPTRSKQANKPSTRGGRQQSRATTAAASSQDATQLNDQQPPLQDIAHQQKLLSIFHGTFDSVLSSGNFNAILQEVKTALFKREFDVAFGKEEFLEAYAARWSPTRTLCYASVLDEICPHLEELCRAEEEKDESNSLPLRVLAIGGAAAELVAFGSYLSRQPADVSGAITLVDIAPWSGVVEKLRAGLKTPPPLSKYASAALHAANTPVNEPERLKEITFKEQDVFALDQDGLAALVSAESSTQKQHQNPILVTLLFTLNELFTSGGIGKTTTFLLTLTSSLPSGSLLLVVDSPGSYSETTVGKEAKRYPMAWLLDKILTGASDGENENERWEKVESKDSVWFRLGGELRYPIPLEDMRYQMHLYRKGMGRGNGDWHEDPDED